MKTCVSLIFLNIMMRAAEELNRAHPNTYAILADMHKMTNILILEVSGNFDLFGPKGMLTPSHLSAS